MHELYILVACMVCLLFFGCASEIETPDYYFPMPEKKEGYIYHYTADDEKLPDEFWHIFQTGERSLRICIMDEFRGWRQCSYEFLASNGIIQDSLWVKDDSLGRLNVEVEHGNLYPMDPIDKTHVYIQYLRWYTSPDSSTYIQVIRNRRYSPHSTQATNLGERYILFEVMEVLEDFQEGYLEIPVKGLEVFEKGKGLVYFEKEYSGNFVQRFSFETKMSIEEFKEVTGRDVLKPSHSTND